jgi:putative DNA primase/helicase
VARKSEDRLELTLATTFMLGMLRGPLPGNISQLEELGCYVRIAEDLIEAYGEHSSHEAAMQKWLALGPEIEDEYPRLWRAVQARLNGHASDDTPLPLSEQTNAETLVQWHGNDLRYCHPFRRWFVWENTHWKEDNRQAIMQRAKTTIKRMAADVQSLDDKEAKALLAHIKTSLSAKSLKAMVELAQSEPGIPVLPEQWDTDPWVVNCLNGVVDLRTGNLRPHQRNDLFSKVIPVAYDPEARCPTWERFLAEIFEGKAGRISFVRRAVGYSLTGDVSERVLFICWGKGRNGKSTFVELIGELLGAYAMRAPTELFTVKHDGAIPNDVAQLPGKRFVHASETDEGKRLSEALIKDITGRDTLSARFMRGEYFEFKPIAKLWLRTNHKPIIRGTDNAIWDRIRLIPFLRRIADGEEDKQLPQKLRAELSGILAWAVSGCLSWMVNGLGLPKEVETAGEDYRAEMDVIGEFIAEQCVIADYASVTSGALFGAYVKWCKENSEEPMSRKALAGRLEERGLVPAKGAHGVRLWRGIGLLDAGGASS